MKLPELKPGLRIPGRGIYVASWTPERHGWMYSDYTEEFRVRTLRYAMRQFKTLVPYVGTMESVLMRDGVIWAYQWSHVTRQHKQGGSRSGGWLVDRTSTTKHGVRRTRWLRWLGIKWRKL